MKHNIRIIQLAILLLSANVSAQLDSFTWLDDEAGLPQNSIKSIVPDKYGFLWLTTENGLVRYDGQEFKTFNSENQNFLNNRFLYIAGKKRDRLTFH
ncbi:two-component regulator propeller domain-containing protein [Flavobacterium aurantiibacter]|uniref:two-component regulator propeller domain-containing protein n=1 Tax=Flavobacterium aurantiibacter TaxID=2023067 RepID=UPI000B96FDA2|nr:two-component regulator propeller domain-containing protein [Flavobacterium aurantiibacter]